jgi:hypothetical protein
MRTALPVLSLAAACLLLGACASDDGNYPSLAKRPAERVIATWPPAPPPPPPAPPPLDPATASRIDHLLSEVRTADARFHGKVARARTLVAAARRAPTGSESWVVATMAVSELEAARARAMLAMSELDSLYAEARTQGREVTAIEAARSQATTIIAGQDRVLDSLRIVLER